MTTLSELIDQGKRHHITLKNKAGKQLLKLALLWTVVIVVAAPQAGVLVLVLALLDVIVVEYDGRRILVWEPEEPKEKAPSS